MDLLREKVVAENIHVHVFDFPNSPHLADDLLIQANTIWREAEEGVAHDLVYSQRVRFSRLTVDYAIAERVRLEIAGNLPMNNELKTIAIHRFEPYVATLQESGVTKLREWSPLNLPAYREGLANVLGMVGGYHLRQK